MPKGCRVSGIYSEGGKFRVVVFWPDRRSIWCHTREEADAVAARLELMLRDQSTRTIEDTLNEYLDARRRSGQRETSLRTLDYKLRKFFPEGSLLGSITPEVASSLYAAEIERIGRYGRPVAVASHRSVLKCCKAFFRWVVEERKYLKQNPFERVKPVGRENTGKPQLRLDEARRLYAWLFQRAERPDGEGAIAVLTQLVLGLRSSEVLNRRVRDVDDSGRLFCVESGKTKNARRWLEIQSEPLQRLLTKQIGSRSSEDWLFGAGREKPYSYTTLWKWLRSYCEQAGVPSVCPHSLRGLHSTLAMEKGATSGLVASALGHGNFAITERHYLQPGTMDSMKLRKVSAALETPGPPSASESAERAKSAPDLDKVTEVLRGLSPDQLSQILRSIGIAR